MILKTQKASRFRILYDMLFGLWVNCLKNHINMFMPLLDRKELS